jgi:acyl-CoA dehydrogenase
MLLLNPKSNLYQNKFLDARSQEIMQQMVDFFEAKGLTKMKEDDRNHAPLDDFVEYQKEHKMFSTFLTPSAYSDDPDARWDTFRNTQYNEILGFYGLAYWYVWQVSILGLGPIWMSTNEDLKKRAAALLRDGAVFAFGLSERAHGADIYGTEMSLTPQDDGTYRANGEKYYIGNGNEAPMVSIFGKFADKDGNIPAYDMENKDQYVFFTANYEHKNYLLKQNVINFQAYVAQFALEDYEITEDDILSKGRDAWNSSLNTVNVGKYNLGWASIGICTHCLYEAIHHASNRHLYQMSVTDFSHVQQSFVDAYTRLVAMKLFGLRTSDYFRVANKKDRRYLLYAPTMKMKVTTEGENVVNLLWDVIAAKGFEKDMYFEMAARDIRALPKLEGTVHVNIALILKFMMNFFLNPANYNEVPVVNAIQSDDFLWDQGDTGGLGKVRFHDWKPAFEKYAHLPNVAIFLEQIKDFQRMGAKNPPTPEQNKDMDLAMALGEIFAHIVYANLVIESAPLHDVDEDTIDQIFDFMVRDFSKFALQFYQKKGTLEGQMEWCLKMIRKPNVDEDRFKRMWDVVHALDGAYTMNE